MKIVVITGSPHQEGTSALLAEKFIEGAQAAGHEVTRFDGAFSKVHACTACDKCHTGAGTCIFKDDIEKLKPLLIAADGVVFAAPIYYYAVASQLKTVIDRFYAFDARLHVPKKVAWLLTCEDDTEESVAGASLSLTGMSHFLGWQVQGKVEALRCATRTEIEKTKFPEQAYELGKNF